MQETALDIVQCHNKEEIVKTYGFSETRKRTLRVFAEDVKAIDAT